MVDFSGARQNEIGFGEKQAGAPTHTSTHPMSSWFRVAEPSLPLWLCLKCAYALHCVLLRASWTVIMVSLLLPGLAGYFIARFALTSPVGIETKIDCECGFISIGLDHLVGWVRRGDGQWRGLGLAFSLVLSVKNRTLCDSSLVHGGVAGRHMDRGVPQRNKGAGARGTTWKRSAQCRADRVAFC